MNRTRKPGSIECEAYRCHNTAKVQQRETPAGEFKALCGVHGKERRWNHDPLLQPAALTPEVIEQVLVRQAEREAALLERQAKEKAEAEQRHAIRVEREWSQYTNREAYTTTLLIEDEWWDGTSKVVLVVHPVGANPERHWDNITVALDCTSADLPMYVEVGGSRNVASPEAALLLAEAIAIASVWVAEANAPAEPAPVFVPIPWTAREKRAMDDEGGRGDRGYGTCLLCGRKTKSGAHWVHEVEGGGVLAPVDFTYTNEAADLGWWEVGPDCAKRLPAGYAVAADTRPVR